MEASLQGYLTSLPYILIIKTQEEDRLVQEIHRSINSEDELNIWNPSFGILPSGQYIDEWDSMSHPMDKDTIQVNAALVQMYKNPAAKSGKRLYYMMLDSDRYLADMTVQRRLRNIAVSSTNNSRVFRSILLVSESGVVPSALEPYVVVHDFDKPDDALIRQVVEGVETIIQMHNSDFQIPHNRDGDTIPDEFIEACRGLTVFQIKETLMHFAVNNNMEISLQDMQDYRKGIIQKTSLLELVDTDITFDDIAGLDKLKVRLDEVRAAWTKEGREYGVPSCRGLLQVGVPGCGKSLIAKALSNEMDVTFVKFDPSNLFSSRVGDSERNMRAALTYIEAVSPCVVFIDEIEKGLAGIQSSSYSDSGTTARVIGTFLSWFQDHDEDVFIIATANGIDNLPPELISRFEEKYFVGLPNEQARKDCFEIQFKKYWKDTMGDFDSLDFGEMAKFSDRLTGREIEQVVMDSIRKGFMSKDRKVTTGIVTEIIESKPPLVLTMEEEIQHLLDWVGYDTHRKEGVRARFASTGDIVEGNVIYDADATDSRAGKLFGTKDDTDIVS